jgi:tetratricopeptide (TPR) repeat protein
LGYAKLINSKDATISTNSVLKLIVIERQTNNQKALIKFEEIAKERRYEPIYGEKTLELLQAFYDRGSYKAAFDSAKEVLNDKKNSPKTMAGARFIQARVLDKEFKDQSLKTSPERLTLVLKMKTEKLEKAQSAFREVIKYGDPEYIVYALRDLALCYDHYVKAVRNIQFTKPVPKEDMDALQAELEKVTVPMEDKAVETISQAVTHAKKFELRDGTIAKVQNIMNELNMRPALTQAEILPPARVVPFLMGGES